MTNQVAQKKQMPAFLVLTIICLIAALALAGTNAITKGPIKEHAMAAQREAFGAVMTADEYVEMTIPEGSGISALVEAKQNGETIGYCVAASSGGYAGPVAVTLGVGTDGKVTGAKIGDTSFAETSGFGSRWLAENQTEQFVGIDVREGGAIEALSGATVTSTAVLNASNTALSVVNDILGIERTEPVLVFGVAEKKPVEQMALVGDIHEGSARGFASDVKVQLTMDDAGAITGLAIESSGETAGFGTRCMEDPTFAEQFVGKTAPFAIGDNIDALSGATVTSTAVVEAVNAAVESPANPDAVPFGAGAEEPAVETAATLSGDVKTGKAQGFQSEVSVQLTVDENGAIAELLVDSGNETPGFGTRCAEDEAFLAQFIGKTTPVEVDALTGATVTSKAVIEAVNAALTAPAAETLTAAAPGFAGQDVGVTITLNEDGTIATITLDNSKQVPPVCDLCNDEAFLGQFIGKKGPFTDADIVTGATFTSEGVINALNSLFAAAEEAPVAGNVMEASVPGYEGAEVKVTVTLDDAGAVQALVVDASTQTPALGGKCAEADFVNQFIGKTGPFTLGTDIDAVSYATITSQAVVDAVNSLYAAEEAPAATGNVLEATAAGYEGAEIKVTVTLDEAGTVQALVVDASTQTPALGGKCAEADFVNQFVGKVGPFTLGTDIDAVSYATITSQAVVDAVNSLYAAEEETPAATGNVLEASMPGYEGAEVKVTVTLDDDGTVQALVVDASTQTPALGGKCAEADFVNQFIGKTGPFTLGTDIDAVSYATITSQAVVDAVNSVYPTQDMSVTEEAPVTGNVLEATAAGYEGAEVKVTVTLDEAGTVQALVVDASTQTPALGGKCAEADFVNQFIGKTGPFTLGTDIDAVSYATITSQAVVDAVNSVYAPAGNVLEASMPGYEGAEIKVTVTLDEAGTVQALVVDASTQTPALGGKCAEADFVNQFIGKTGPFTLGTDIDAVSYATITSQAVVDAVNSVYPTQDMSVTEEAPVTGNVLEASMPGYEGAEIKVTVTLDEAGTVQALVVDASTQTPALGGKCAEADFVNQFVGKVGPFTLGTDIDAVSYATITSQAVVDAVNSVYPTQDMSVTGEELPIEEVPAAGTVLEATAAGYEGAEVKVTVTLDDAGTVQALVVDASTQTPALGGKCAEADFVNQFIGKVGPFTLGTDIDAVSYATITSQAVVDAVNSLYAAEEETSAATGTVLEATAAGYEGAEVKVTVTLDEAGTVQALVVDASTQTPTLGGKCAEADFVNQFIGKVGPFTLGTDIDAVSYATITSQAVVDAVNSVYAPAGNVLEASMPGYEGAEIKVTVTLDDAGTVQALVVDASTQTPALGGKCAEADFVNQFIGKTGPFTLGTDIDAVSYATITSQAVVDAVNSVLVK